MPTVFLTSAVTVDAIAYPANVSVEFDRVTAADVVGSQLGVYDSSPVLGISAGYPHWDHGQVRAMRSVSGRSATGFSAAPSTYYAGASSVVVFLTSAVIVDAVSYAAGTVVVFDAPTARDLVTIGTAVTSIHSIIVALSNGAVEIEHSMKMRQRLFSAATPGGFTALVSPVDGQFLISPVDGQLLMGATA